jgi:tRNA-2-methylthio-N6-dimethylallyladenosine synthase
MNAHDSEKVANLLHYAGYRLADAPEQAELLIVNTCSIREKAEHRLYSDLGKLAHWKRGAPGRILGVGGCVAQQEGDGLLRRFPQVDFVFGTHNLRWVPAMVRSAERGVRAARVEASPSLDRFDFPEQHPAYTGSNPGRAYVTVMEGCDLFCSFCIVPITRGREISRPAADILREAESLAARGVREITLLGQTVNAYGRHDLRRGQARERGTVPFAALLRRLDRIPGLRRLRYTSPHPLFFDGDLIRAHAELETLCPHVHLPLQSGSDAVLARMRRRHTRDDFRRLVDRLREARPDLALTTDLIVAFPGETESDFEATLALVREVAFVDSYSFKYSPRPGTQAAGLPGCIGDSRAQQRLEALQGLQRRLTLAAHRARVGGETEVLVEGPSRRGASQLAGRDPYHRVVNFEPDPGGGPSPGDLAELGVVEATPHSLIGARRAPRPAETPSIP